MQGRNLFDRFNIFCHLISNFHVSFIFTNFQECDEIMQEEEEYSDVGTEKVNKYFPTNRYPLTQSRTLDSLNEMTAMKAGTPSTISRQVFFHYLLI